MQVATAAAAAAAARAPTPAPQQRRLSAVARHVSSSTTAAPVSSLVEAAVGVPVAAALSLFALVNWATGPGRRPSGAADNDSSPPPESNSADAAPPLGPGDEITVVTWNLHFGIGAENTTEVGRSRQEVLDNLDSIGAHLKGWGADICLLQEIDRSSDRSKHTDQVEHLKKATGLPFALWTTVFDKRWVPHPGLNPAKHIGRVWSGQVVLSRWPLEEAPNAHIPLPQPSSLGSGGSQNAAAGASCLYSSQLASRALSVCSAAHLTCGCFRVCGLATSVRSTR